jgi:transketolase N-terminal domain/subunit
LITRDYTNVGIIGVYSTIEKALAAAKEKLQEWIAVEDINDREDDMTLFYIDLIEKLKENFSSTGFYIDDFVDCEQVIIDKTY